MDTARKNCIWFDQCGHDCMEGCDNFTPVESSDVDETFYLNALRENVQEYEKLVWEFLGKEGL